MTNYCSSGNIVFDLEGEAEDIIKKMVVSVFLQTCLQGVLILNPLILSC